MPPIIFDVLELEAILSEQEEHQTAVLLARNYYRGKQEVYLNARALEYLGIHNNNTFRFNICKTIVRALADELNLLGFVTDESAEEGSRRPVAEWLATLFEESKLDSIQADTHKAALSDSESFVIVEWDPGEGRVNLTDNPYYIGTDAGGDGLGVYMVYENDDPKQKPLAAVKRWPEVIRSDSGYQYTRQRATIYYPDHFERWVFDDGGVWKHFVEDLGENEDGERIIRDWTLPNVDPQTGEPLGIPVFHFKNEDLAPEHWDGIPMQDGINKTLVEVFAAGDLTAFQMYFGFGFYPTTDGQPPKTDGSNLMKVGPAQFNGTMKTPDQAALQVIQGQDTTFLMSQFKDLVLATAQITETPVSRFIVTAAIASEKTIKEQERGLRKKGAKRRKLFSDSWVGVANMARKLSNIYGAAGLSEEIAIAPLWEHTETLEELAEKKTTLGIPTEQLWREAGYSETQIEQMKKEPSYRVEFERALWEGYQQASLNGLPLRTYLERIGLPDEEIEALLRSIEENSPIPATEL